MILGILRCLAQPLDDMAGCGDIRITDSQVDDILPLCPLLRDLPRDLDEKVGRQVFNTLSSSHFFSLSPTSQIFLSGPQVPGDPTSPVARLEHRRGRAFRHLASHR